MYKLGYILSSIILMSFFLINCSGDVTNDSSDSQSSFEQYLITTDGDYSVLSQNDVDAEYSKFLFLSNEVDRKIYIGGKFPGYSSNANKVWLTNSSIWQSFKFVEGIKILNDYTYYSSALLPTNIPSYDIFGGNEYTINMQLGYEDMNFNYTNIGNSKNIVFQIAPIDARFWNLDIYQQVSYNTFNLAIPNIPTAFNPMNVTLVYLNNASSSLADEVLPWNYYPSWYIPAQSAADNFLVIYGYSKVYPNQPNTAAAIEDFAINKPTTGLLFNVKNYTLTTAFQDPNPLATTWASFTTLGRKPCLVMVYVQKIKDMYHSDWEDRAISNATLHELGHLWCDNITPDVAHQKWHNGDNFDRCLMHTNLLVNGAGEPYDDRTKKILEYQGFCEGHLQRGMNVSWLLKQFIAPPPPPNEPELKTKGNFLASNSRIFEKYYDGKIDIKLSSQKKEYLKGELIDVFVELKNTTADTIQINNFWSILDSKQFSNPILQEQNSQNKFILTPYAEYKYIVDPLSLIKYSQLRSNEKSTRYWNYWPEGNYQYYMTYEIDNEKYLSNILDLQVLPVPDNLQAAFLDLTEQNSEEPEISLDSYLCDKYERLSKTYSNSYFAKEFYTKLLISTNYFFGIINQSEGKKIRDKAIRLTEEFIEKYPNCITSYKLFERLLGNFNENREVIERTVAKLKLKDSESWVLKSLQNSSLARYKNLQYIFEN